ncbi:hypothetical protein [Streptomyces sp. SP18CS02]|uniref:hypothetical protein n=1 Tax=Streptomyces sp. SP18CS02 TaxID=3002531 RepID=UPI002E7756C7|nr:hypothetical protein [Streptomyces sp. SP18CS02]MEE1753746.1 hypothetical protein [Streptomyces sp. SP18CS02]
MPAPPAAPSPSSASESASDVVRWAAFSCALVPVVLVVYGTSVGGAAATAVGLAAVTAVCRILLRRSERTPVRPLVEDSPAHARPPGPPRGRHSRTSPGARHGGRPGAGCAPGD